MCFFRSVSLFLSPSSQYKCIRLSEVTSRTISRRAELKSALMSELMADPPHSLRWLKEVTSRQNRDAIIRAVTDPSRPITELLTQQHRALADTVQYSQLLMLRGLIAHSLLEFVLEKKHRVEYGLPAENTRKKRLAVPYRAADVPSERSEFRSEVESSPLLLTIALSFISAC